MPRFGLFLVLVSLLCACQSSPKVTVPAMVAPQLQSGSRIYIRLPPKFQPKGKQEKDDYIESATSTAEAFRASFLRFSKVVNVGREAQTFAEALATATEKRADYLVFPEILNWEDHPTEWTAMRDKVTLKVTMYEVASSRVVYEKILDSKSRFMTDGGDHTSDLLPDLADSFTSSLFQIHYTPSALR